MGGLEVTIRPRKGDVGKIVVELTDWRTGKPFEGEWAPGATEMTPYVEAALKGIDEVAQRHGSLPDQFDVELSKFLYHTVDSHPQCYFQAAKSAYHAALEAWYVRDLDGVSDQFLRPRRPNKSRANRLGEGVRSFFALARKLLKCRFSVYRN